MRGSGRDRAFCRAAAAAFVAVVLYTVATKLRAGELGGDWAHTVLHVATAVAAALAGREQADATWARATVLAVLVGYGVLGTFGWFVEGLLLGSRLEIPLGPADNTFHLVLAVAAAATVASPVARRIAPGAGTLGVSARHPRHTKPKGGSESA